MKAAFPAALLLALATLTACQGSEVTAPELAPSERVDTKTQAAPGEPVRSVDGIIGSGM